MADDEPPMDFTDVIHWIRARLKLPGFVGKVLPVTLGMMVRLGEDISEWQEAEPLDGLNDDEGADNAVRVAFRMTQPFRFEFYVDGVMLPESEYDVSEQGRLPTLADPHGSYAFHPQHRTLYFVLRGGAHNGVPATRGGGFVVFRMLQVVALTLTSSVPLVKKWISWSALYPCLRTRPSTVL